MKKRIRCCVLILIFSVLALQQTVVSAAEQTLPSGISFDEIESKMQAFEKKHADTTAGLAVSVFTSKEDVTQYAGYTDMEKKIKTDETSVFEWGSTTKLLVFLSVMQQLEQNNLDLDTDIRTYLPKDFLKNLTFAEPVTMTELMNHTAGFQEEYVGLYEKGITAYPSLKEALYEHEPKQVYKPGTVTAYSNWGVALAAYIVERVSGQEFSSYVREHIFTPLGMNHTAVSVDLSDCPWVQKQWKKLQCYTADGEKIKDCKTPLLLYPAGRAVSTLADFRTFAKAILTKDEALLSEKTWELLFTPTDYFGTTTVPKNAHGFWMISYGVPVYGHGGNTMGCSANLLLDQKDGVGFVVMTNQAYEEVYNEQMPTLVFGTYDRKAYTKEKTIPSGIYRTARTNVKGPFKWMSLTYKIREVDDDQLWIASDTAGVAKICYAYGDDIRISTAEFVSEIGLVLLWGLALLFAMGSLLVQGIAACMRKIKKKTARLPFRNWGLAANGMQLLVLFCFIGMVYGVSTYRKWETYAWLFAVMGLLAVFMAVLLVYGIVKSKRHPWMGKKLWFCGNLFFLLVTVLNIGYWNLYQFWG